jgi:hypothetical protein
MWLQFCNPNLDIDSNHTWDCMLPLLLMLNGKYFVGSERRISGQGDEVSCLSDCSMQTSNLFSLIFFPCKNLVFRQWEIESELLIRCQSNVVVVSHSKALCLFLAQNFFIVKFSSMFLSAIEDDWNAQQAREVNVPQVVCWWSLNKLSQW